MIPFISYSDFDAGGHVIDKGDVLLSGIIGHLVGDYLLQNDWMALNKKKLGGEINCLVHCLLWTLSVCLFSGWHSAAAIIVLFFSHIYQDRTDIIAWWMDLIGQKQFRTGPCAPWSVIVVDNVWHILTIWLVWKIQF